MAVLNRVSYLNSVEVVAALERKGSCILMYPIKGKCIRLSCDANPTVI